MAIKNNDFIELEFTGKISDTNEVFDTNIGSDAKKENLDIKNIKPFTMSVGHKMLPTGFDEDLIGKEPGKEYTIEISPDKAFGKRDQKLVRMVPTKMFLQQNIRPERGMQMNVDGTLTKVLSTSAQRTLVDFNNPLAGKNLTYKYKILKIVEEDKEKVDAIQDFLFRKILDYDLNGKDLKFKVKAEEKQFIEMFKEKLEEILGMKVSIEEKPEEKKEIINF